MTEEEWLTCEEPDVMLARLGVRGNERKVGLFDVACCRRIQHLLTVAACCVLNEIERYCDENFPIEAVDKLIELAEEESDRQGGGATAKEMGIWCALEAVYCAAAGYRGGAASNTALAVAFEQPEAAKWQPGDGFLDPLPAECALQTALLRDIFGNPFRPATFSPSWRTDTAVALARTMYASRDFSAMPILADALQDAGCDNTDILSHCRDRQQTHVRGCWVVDLVLGKS